MRNEEIGISDAATDIVVLIAPHHEKIGCRQNRDRDTNVGEAARQDREVAGRYQRQLGHVPDDDPPAAAILLCQLADVVDEHPLGRVADIEVQVDVAIVFTGKFVASSPRNVACS